jgi:phosphate transport system protein
MPSQHTVRSYDEELKFLTHKIAEMGGHAERMVEQSVAAIVNADNALAQRVISDDLILDASEREIDDKAVMIIAKRQPMAVWARTLPSALQPFRSPASRSSSIVALKLWPNWR